jgi:TonB family protein
MVRQSQSYLGDTGLSSVFRSPFLIPSLMLHAMLVFFALRAATLSIAKPETNVPISVQLLEVREGGSDNKSIGPGKGPAGPRTAPKLGVPLPPAQRTGKLDNGSTEISIPSNQTEAAPLSKPALPGPKVLATDTRYEAVNVKEASPDSLVRLPTKDSTNPLAASAAADVETNQKSVAALKGVSEGPGIKALKEGNQIPGALKGMGSGTGPYGAPGGSKSGTGTTGGGTGVGTGGGSSTGLKGIANLDYNQYLQQLEKRVRSVWKYPDDVSGIQKVAIRFALDRAGKLMQADVLDSSDSRLNASAVEAMKRASPFPPIPESLKDLANEPLIIRFTVSIRVRG